VAAALLAPAAVGAERDPLVRGGTVPPAGDWGWTVAVVFHGEPNAVDGQFCSGTLVAPTIVVTAAHCLVNDKTGEPMAAARVDVITGRIDLKASGGQRIVAADLRIHPDWKKQDSADVGVIVLSEPSTAPTARLADDPERARWRAGRQALVGGWGLIGEATFPARLHVAQVPIRQEWNCALLYGITWDGASSICAGGGQTATACAGDSGGPLMVRDASGTPALVGLVSYGPEVCSAKVPIPTAYVDLTAFDDWVREQIPDLPPEAYGGPEPRTDSAGPRVTAIEARGRLGKSVDLPYRVVDDSGTSREIVTVYVGRRLVRRQALGLGPAAPFLRYSGRWVAPRTMPSAPARFCVTSYDPTGNASEPACAPITLRP
jgi:secreted trypsin-like serine protease